MHRLLLGFCFLVLGLGWELAARRSWGRSPSGWRALLAWGSRSTAPDRKYPALLFASVAVALFAFWESFLRFILDGYTAVIWPWLGCVLALLWFVRRAKVGRSPVIKAALVRGEPLIFFLILCVTLEAWFNLVLLPWIYLRSAFLSPGLYHSSHRS